MRSKLEETLQTLRSVSKDLEDIKHETLAFCKSCDGYVKETRDMLNELSGVKRELSFFSVS